MTIIMVLLISLLASSASSVRGVSGGPIGDDYNYSSVDPDCTKWNCAPAEMIQECDPGTTVCHDMRVDNPPGFLFSENYACHYGWDPSSTHSGCGRDARMHSAESFTYTAGTGQQMVLTERYSPNRRDATLCPIWVPGNRALNTAWPPDDYSMHWIGLKYASQSSSFAYIIVEHACLWDGFTPNWKYGLRAYYTDANGADHYQYWTDYVFDDNQWLDLTMEVGNNGQDTRLTVKNISTGLAYFMNIGTNLGATSGSVEISAQYRHNEASRTDYVDARISDPDFSMSAGPTLNACTEGQSGQRITLTSLNSFSGTVSLSSMMDWTSSYVLQYPSPTPITLLSGGSADFFLVFRANDFFNSGGTYRVVVTAVSGSTSHNIGIIVNVSSSYCTPTPNVSLTTDSPSSFTLFCTYYAGCDPALPWYFYLHVQSLNGFSGTVTLGYTVDHYGGPNITGPTSASVSSGGSTRVTLYVQGGGATSGTYYWTLSGSGGGYTTFTIYYSYCRSCVSPSP